MRYHIKIQIREIYYILVAKTIIQRLALLICAMHSTIYLAMEAAIVHRSDGSSASL